MKRTLRPARSIGGTITLPGDKSIAHRAALFSIIAKAPITVKNFPNNADCLKSLEAARVLGVKVKMAGEDFVLTPPESLQHAPDTIIDCGNSGTTARLLSGILAGSKVEGTLTGDDSLRHRPMKRIIDPLTDMGAELFADEGRLPMRIRGTKLRPFEYLMPVASAQVKSALLLAGLASSSAVIIREDRITRDHTETMARELGDGISVRDVKRLVVADQDDPRKRHMQMSEPFKREITLSADARITGGSVDIPGDISTGAFFMAAAAISGRSLTIENMGLNPTRTGMLNHLKAVGCAVEITGKRTISREPRGTVTVTGGALKSRRISGETTVALIDEIPIVAVMAAFATGTTVIRDAGELRVKESDRLTAISENLRLMGVKCGVLEDGLAIDGGRDLSGADFLSHGDHRIAMAFSIASLFLVGPSTVDDDAVVAVSCPGFYELLDQIVK
ncbi:MAG: 3-phosphoshikimate 1-carboxyvinyltransferase [candidate division Zixibacteria bacterium]|nr:3-phosphoshikimate 1-carboxyvinyltransferase [candidate division Zixibacteria bacterium]